MTSVRALFAEIGAQVRSASLGPSDRRTAIREPAPPAGLVESPCDVGDPAPIPDLGGPDTDEWVAALGDPELAALVGTYWNAFRRSTAVATALSVNMIPASPEEPDGTRDLLTQGLQWRARASLAMARLDLVLSVLDAGILARHPGPQPQVGSLGESQQ